MHMKELNGREVAGFIKERQAHEVRSLRQAHHVTPRLAIVRTNDDPAITLYVRLKKAYGDDIGVVVDEYMCDETEVQGRIESLNADQTVHGIIVQLPLSDTSQTERILNLVSPLKDVDGLANETQFVPATPQAILWLLAAYNIELSAKRVVVMGQGRLVGAPLAQLLVESGVEVQTIDLSTENPAVLTSNADVIITAVGKKDVLTAEMVKPGVVVVDAGVATDVAGFEGDINDDVRSVLDIRVTPKKGGVGPLTVAALFENVLTAAKRLAV